MNAPADAEPKTPRAWIEELMIAQGVRGAVSKHLVLWAGIFVMDSQGRRWAISAKIDRPIQTGAHVWVQRQSETAELTPVEVLEDRGDTLWVRDYDVDVEFLVQWEDVSLTPIPLRPTVVHKRELPRYVGQAEAQQWNRKRRQLRS